LRAATANIREGAGYATRFRHSPTAAWNSKCRTQKL